MKKILVTGANGFVGSSLVRTLIATGYEVVSENLSEVDVIVHLAARVHVMRDRATDPLAAFRRVNVAATKHLAEQAVAAGVKRFIFISSLHVNGTCSHDHPFVETDKIAPISPYAISKWEAEEELRKIQQDSAMELVIVRPPLVYGPQVRANFLSLLKLVKLGLPLPLAAVANKRSLVSLMNLVDFLRCCIEHPKAGNELFFVSDDCDVSIGGLIRLIAKYLQRPARLFSVAPKILYSCGRLLGRKATVERLCGSLQVDISKAKRLLDWVPPQSLEDGVKETVAWYTSN